MATIAVLTSMERMCKSEPRSQLQGGVRRISNSTHQCVTSRFRITQTWMALALIERRRVTSLSTLDMSIHENHVCILRPLVRKKERCLLRRKTNTSRACNYNGDTGRQEQKSQMKRKEHKQNNKNTTRKATNPESLKEGITRVRWCMFFLHRSPLSTCIRQVRPC